MKLLPFKEHLEQILGPKIQSVTQAFGELTLALAPQNLREVAFCLRDDPRFQFEMLMDLCAVDYLHYGASEWATQSATRAGFSRGVETCVGAIETPARFAVIYHLLSLKNNHRLRLRVYVPEETLTVPSVLPIWNSANWYEREAFDLFGIFFEDHPDLRRILTDYGFIGHPFRKDFPLMGEVEMRYSAEAGRVIYEPVTQSARTLVPKTIRADNEPEEGALS